MTGSGLAADGIHVRERKLRARSRRSPRWFIAGAAVTGIVLALIALLAIPWAGTYAFPGRTGGGCNVVGCHTNPGTFLTVTGFPTTYVPSQEYTITVSVVDPNGWANDNSFDMILATGGGTVVGVSQYVKNVSALEVATNQAFNASVAQWTVKWTAPASGTVTVDTWAVTGTGGSGAAAQPYDHITTTMNSTAIPEFSGLLVPIIGMMGLLVLVFGRKKRRAA